MVCDQVCLPIILPVAERDVPEVFSSGIFLFRNFEYKAKEIFCPDLTPLENSESRHGKLERVS